MLKTNPMKNRLRNLEDIRREKQKLALEIRAQEYALSLNFRQIRNKFTLASFSSYAFDIVRERIRASIPSFLTGILGGLWRVFVKRKK